MKLWELTSADGEGNERQEAVEANCLTASGDSFCPSPLLARVLISRYCELGKVESEKSHKLMSN